MVPVSQTTPLACCSSAVSLATRRSWRPPANRVWRNVDDGQGKIGDQRAPGERKTLARR